MSHTLPHVYTSIHQRAIGEVLLESARNCSIHMAIDLSCKHSHFHPLQLSSMYRIPAWNVALTTVSGRGNHHGMTNRMEPRERCLLRTVVRLEKRSSSMNATAVTVLHCEI